MLTLRRSLLRVALPRTAQLRYLAREAAIPIKTPPPPPSRNSASVDRFFRVAYFGFTTLFFGFLWQCYAPDSFEMIFGEGMAKFGRPGELETPFELPPPGGVAPGYPSDVSNEAFKPLPPAGAEHADQQVSGSEQGEAATESKKTN